MVLALLGLAAAPAAVAQTSSITTLATFSCRNGSSPYTGVILSDGVIYGTTLQGGTNNKGTVYSVPITGGSPTVLASFNGTNGQNPAADLILCGSTLYGITVLDGANHKGTVFSVPITGGGSYSSCQFQRNKWTKSYIISDSKWQHLVRNHKWWRRV